MGNCLVHQNKVVKIMKTDGKILEYQTPIRVNQILSEFVDHSVSDALPVRRHLSHDTNMVGGHVYYLVPPPPPPLPTNRVVEIEKTSRISKQGTEVVRVKLVMTKQELREMLRKGGVSSVDEMLCQLQTQQSEDNCEDDDGSCTGWRPVLESIPE